MKRRDLIGIGLLALLSGGAVARADVWDDLDADIAPLDIKTLNVEEFKKAPRFARFLETADTSLLYEMSQQGNSHPWVAVAGLAALRAKDADGAYFAAMRAVWRLDSVAKFPPLGIVGAFLKGAVPESTNFNPACEALCSFAPHNTNSFNTLIRMLPIARLETWLQSKPQTRCITAECLVADAVCFRYQSDGKAVPAWLQAKIKAYGDLPGMPKVVYLLLRRAERQGAYRGVVRRAQGREPRRCDNHYVRNALQGCNSDTNQG